MSDLITLQRRLHNEEFLLAALQRQADFVNKILDLIEEDKLEEWLQAKSAKIAELQNDIDRNKLTILMKESGL